MLTFEDISGPTAVYRLRDDDGRLLYVGISADPLNRWLEHAAEKAWWEFVTRFEVAWFENRALAEAEEARAIRAEQPEFNRAGVEDLKPRRPRLAYSQPHPDRHRTPRVAIAVDDDSWRLLGELVGDRQRSEIIRSFIAWYVGVPDATLPEPPSAAEVDAARRRLTDAA